VKDINFKERSKKIQNKIIEKDIDLLLITPSINFGYLFQGFFSLSERLICGMVFPDDQTQLVTPSFEKERMQIETTFDDVITWQEDENPYEILRKSIDKKINTIALESSAPFDVYVRLKKQFPEAKFVNGGLFIKELRSIKNDAEIERMRKAANWTAEGIIKTLDIIKEDQSELEVLKIVQEQMSSLSNEPGWAIVQFDENSAIPHGHPSKKKLKKDSIVLIDAGTTCEHYFADITVTSVFGKASKEFLEIYSIVEEANEAALAASKEGIPAENVDFAARTVIEKAGYGEYFTHRLGHGLGLEVHEDPYIVKGNKNLLVNGNVHTDEPGIYIPNKFGVRIEDDVLVSKKGERLVTFVRKLWK
jgi:Xaa-Pro dipeptidase